MAAWVPKYPRGLADDRTVEFRRDFEDRADESKAKTRRVAPAEPTWPAKLLKTKDRELAERVGFEPTCRLPDKTLSRRPRYDHFGTSPLGAPRLKELAHHGAALIFEHPADRAHAVVQ